MYVCIYIYIYIYTITYKKHYFIHFCLFLKLLKAIVQKHFLFNNTFFFSFNLKVKEK